MSYSVHFRRSSLRGLFFLGMILFGIRLYGEDFVILHPASAMLPLSGVDGTLPPAAASYQLDMVMGEREGFQVGIKPASTEKKIIGIQITARLTNSPAASLFRVLPVNHVTPSEHKTFKVPSRRLGLIPDVLMPMKNRAADDFGTTTAKDPLLTYYVEFETQAETQPQTYEYDMVIQTGAGATKFGIKVVVHPIPIPVRLPFRTAIHWYKSLKEYYGAPLTIEQKRVFWNFCLDYRLSPCVFYAREPDPVPAELAPLKERGLSVVNLLNLKAGKFLPAKQENADKYEKLLKEWREELKKLDLLNDTVFFLADEPDPALDTAEIQKNVEWIKKIFPEAKALVVTQPRPAWTEFVDVFDVVTAYSTDFYKPHAHDEMLRSKWLEKKKESPVEYWWFHSVEPYAPYTNLRIDNRPIEARVSGWQNAQYRVDGYEYFWIAEWADNLDSKNIAWPKRAETWKTGLSGAGNLCYPDEKSEPMPSLRLVNLRDGIEDWALLEMLNPRQSSSQESALIAPVSKNLAEYTTKPSVLLEQRLKVIEALKKR